MEPEKQMKVMQEFQRQSAQLDMTVPNSYNFFFQGIAWHWMEDDDDKSNHSISYDYRLGTEKNSNAIIWHRLILTTWYLVLKNWIFNVAFGPVGIKFPRIHGEKRLSLFNNEYVILLCILMDDLWIVDHRAYDTPPHTR